MFGMLAICGAVALSIGACSSPTSGASGAACSIDLDCGRGQVCSSGRCGVVECATFSDCGSGQICIDDATGKSSTGKVCTGIECGDGKPCPAGSECAAGLCTGGGTDATESTDSTDSTDSCTTNDDCPDKTVCDQASGSCVAGEVPSAPTGACAKCDTEACPDELTCTKIGGADHCSTTCSVKGDCTSGWECFQGHCVPGLYSCGGCLLSGCAETPDKPYCDPGTGECTVEKAVCGECPKGDAQCGPGKRCHSRDAGGQKACVPVCASDADCPANGSCKDVGEGVKLCEWKTEGMCCFGESCTGGVDPCDEANCSGDTPHCKAGACVQCLDSSHCGGDTPKCENAQCVAGDVPPTCSGDAPHWNEAKDQCCECLNDSHCPGEKCGSSCSCEATGTGDACDDCEDPYPGCANFQEQWVCVQCSDDSHCGGNECNTETYTCIGLPPTTSDCKEEGCFNAADVCDESTGLCVSKDGNCDNVTQFCPNGGACMSQIELLTSCFPGGGLPPIPGAGGGGTGIPGQCECTLGAGEIPGFAQGDCAAGFTCGPHPLAAILALLTGGTCTPSNVCNAAP